MYGKLALNYPLLKSIPNSSLVLPLRPCSHCLKLQSSLFHIHLLLMRTLRSKFRWIIPWNIHTTDVTVTHQFVKQFIAWIKLHRVIYRQGMDRQISVSYVAFATRLSHVFVIKDCTQWWYECFDDINLQAYTFTFRIIQNNQNAGYGYIGNILLNVKAVPIKQKHI